MAFNCKVPSYYYVQAMNESILTRNACIAEPHKAQCMGGRGRSIKGQGWKEGENWSKLSNLGGWVSTLALTVIGM